MGRIVTLAGHRQCCYSQSAFTLADLVLFHTFTQKIENFLRPFQGKPGDDDIATALHGNRSHPRRVIRITRLGFTRSCLLDGQIFTGKS